MSHQRLSNSEVLTAEVDVRDVSDLPQRNSSVFSVPSVARCSILPE
jgi:hypothetical protein